MTSLQVTVLVVATVLLAASGAVVLWRELGRGTEGGFVRSWRDLLGLAVTLGGLAVLLTRLWTLAR